MSTFTRPPTLRPASDSRQGFHVVTPFEYHVGCFPSTDIISIPPDFYTDGISIPAVFHWVVKRWGRGCRAGIVHDYLYKQQTRPRKECDQIFREGLKVLGISSWRRTIIYCTLRAFGGFAWRRHQR